MEMEREKNVKIVVICELKMTFVGSFEQLS